MASGIGVLGGMGNIWGNAIAENEALESIDTNRRYYAEQERSAWMRGFREEELFIKEAETVIGGQENVFAQAGVTLEGTALAATESTRMNALDEIAAIRFNTEHRANLFQIKRNRAESRLRTRSSTGYQIFNGLGAFVGGGTAQNMANASSNDDTGTDE